MGDVVFDTGMYVPMSVEMQAETAQFREGVERIVVGALRSAHGRMFLRVHGFDPDHPTDDTLVAACPRRRFWLRRVA